MYKLDLDSKRSKYLQLATNLTVLFLLIFSIVIWNPGDIWAWNRCGIDRAHPELGLEQKDGKDCEETHEWIVRQAIEYLKEKGYIPAGSWYVEDEFKDFLQWGVSYADDTREEKLQGGCSAFSYNYDEPWDIDGLHHFYEPEEIDIQVGDIRAPVLEIGKAICGDIVHVGDLAAPEYSGQLFERAVEFWEGGKPPLDLDTLTEPFYLGYNQDLDHHYYSGWARGTDPGVIWEVPNENPVFDINKNESCSYIKKSYYKDELSITQDFYTEIVCKKAKKPEWPPWVKGGLEDNETAAIYLGWALHMIQDMSVYHHAINRHGEGHKDYENFVDERIRNSNSIDDDLPMAEDGNPLCIEYQIDPFNEGITFEDRTHCYHLYDEYKLSDYNSVSAEDLAHSVAQYAKKEAFFEPYASPYAIWGYREVNYQYHVLDAAIKASAILILKFINEVEKIDLPEDKFETENNNPNFPLSPGSYYDLTIHNESDHDYYLIEMPYQGDLEIRIDYDNKLAEIGVQLDGPYQPSYPTATAQGYIFKPKGIASGKYVLHLSPITKTYYDLHIAIGGKRLDPDWIDSIDYPDYKYNDTPATAFHIPNYKYWEEKDLNIHHAGDNDYFELLAPVGYKIDVSMTFEPSEGDLRLFLNNKEVKGVQNQSLKLATDFRGVRRPSVDKKAVQEAKKSLSPIPTSSDQSKKTLSISRCSSGRDIIRIIGEPSYYSISVTQTVDFDHCRAKFSPSEPGDTFPPNTTIKPKPFPRLPPGTKIKPKRVPRVPPSTTIRPKPFPRVPPSTTIRPKPFPRVPPGTTIRPKPFPRVPPSTTIKPKPVAKVPPSTTIRSKPVVKVPPSTTVQPKPVVKVPASTTIQPNPVAKVPPSTTIQPKPVVKVPPSTPIQPKPVLKSTVQMQRTYR